MGVDELNKRWETAAACPILPEMSFDGEFLILGAQTRLTKADKVAPNSAAQASETGRLTALLAAAHGRPIEASPLRHIQRAVEKKRAGDMALALVHLALSGLAKLREPKEDARRLFMADVLMSDGVDPLVILKGLGLDARSSDEALEKYSPDQPRVPAGNPDGGQWTSGNWEDASSGSRPSRTSGVQVADASATRGHEVRTDAASITDAAYRGTYHDFLRDEFADVLRKAGNTVLTEVPLVLPGDPPITAKVDILFRTIDGLIYGIEVKTGDDPSFTPQQRIVYPHVEAGGIVVSPDPSLPTLGLTPGVPFDRIEIVVMKTAGPGAPIQFVPISKYMSP